MKRSQRSKRALARGDSALAEVPTKRSRKVATVMSEKMPPAATSSFPANGEVPDLQSTSTCMASAPVLPMLTFPAESLAPGQGEREIEKRNNVKKITGISKLDGDSMQTDVTTSEDTLAYELREIGLDFYSRNWTLCTLGLMYTSDGINAFIDNECKRFHRALLEDLQLTKCNECCIDNLLPHSPSECPNCECICRDGSPNRRMCPNSVCGKIFDKLHAVHRFRKPNLMNSNISLWCTDYFEVAKAFLSAGYHRIGSMKEAELAALLTIGINMTTITHSDKIITSFEKLRKARNCIVHNPCQQLPETEMDDHIQIMIDVLTCTVDMQKDPEAQSAVDNLKQLTEISNVYVQKACTYCKEVLHCPETVRMYKTPSSLVGVDALGLKRELSIKNDWNLLSNETGNVQEMMIHSLLSKKVFPKEEELSDILNKFDKTITGKISEEIRNLSENFLKVTACYKPADRNTVVFLIMHEGHIDCSLQQSLSPLNIEYRHKNFVNDEMTTVFRNEAKLMENEKKNLDQTIVNESKALFQKHSNLTSIFPNNVKSSGFRQKNQKFFNNACIVLCVPVKGLIPFFEEPFPTMIGNYPTDVMEGTFSLFGPTSTERHTSLKTGCQIASLHGAGTLGPFIKRMNGNVGFITSAHVVGDVNILSQIQGRQNLNWPIYQPDLTNDNNQIGLVKEVKIMSNVEIAVVEISRMPVTWTFPENGFCSSKKHYSGEYCRTPDEVETGMKVYMFRSQTGASTGIICNMSCRFPIAVVNGTPIILANQILVRNSTKNECSQPGDSGSTVFVKKGNGDFKILGILEGGNNLFSTITPIWNICDAVQYRPHIFVPKETQ